MASRNLEASRQFICALISPIHSPSKQDPTGCCPEFDLHYSLPFFLVWCFSVKTYNALFLAGFEENPVRGMLNKNGKIQKSLPVLVSAAYLFYFSPFVFLRSDCHSFPTKFLKSCVIFFFFFFFKPEISCNQGKTIH